jgi:cytochrome c oxidase subunit I+III
MSRGTRTDLTPNPPQSALALHRQIDAVWRNAPGWRGWLTSSSHNDLGMRFMLTAFFFFSVAGLLSMLIRAQLATRDGAFLSVEQYNQIFTMHGTLMMFMFATPMFTGLGSYFLPRMLGSRDGAYPRLSALGWWCYLLGGVILLVALIAGVAPDGGWFMYTPLSSKTYTPGVNADVWLLGITFVEVSAIAAAVDITVSILRLRAPGMRLIEMPLMAWYLLGAAVMMLVGFPPLILGSLLLELERAFNWPFFDPLRGGDALLWQHLFWLFGHPEVYIVFLPAAGVISTILPVMARTRIMGYGAIVAAILGLVFLSFGLWVHHMFAVGIPHMALAFFSAASALVAVPTAVQIFLWIGTLWRGHPRMHLPMLYLMGFFATFVLGGLTGVMLAIVPFNWQAHDTAFVTAHLHYVLVGGFVFPMMAGIVYWMPFISGREPVSRLSQWAFWLILVGFHGTFLLMHLTGLLGMPRRIAAYPDQPQWEWLNFISSFFGFVMTVGFALFAISLVLQAIWGARSMRNPWNADGREWDVPRFKPLYNFASLPLLGQNRVAIARGEGALPGAPRGQREVLAVDAISGAPSFVVMQPAGGWLPLATACAIACFVLLLLVGQYGLAACALAGVVVLGWCWGAPALPIQDWGRVQVLPGVQLPMHMDVAKNLTYAGVVALLVADGSLYLSFLFGIGFLSVIAPNWPPPQSVLGSLHAIASGAVLVLLAVQCWLARLPIGWRAWAGTAVGVAALAVVLWLASALDDPTQHARSALHAFALAYVGAHTLIATMLAARTGVQSRDGSLSATRAGAQPVWQLWQTFTFTTALLVWCVVLLQQWAL